MPSLIPPTAFPPLSKINPARSIFAMSTPTSWLPLTDQTGLALSSLDHMKSVDGTSLDREVPLNLKEARMVIEDYRRHYNEKRPNS